MNCWARLKHGDTAHRVYQHYISERTLPNLWGTHPPFQIDGNFGTMAGVIEMLLQSHGAYIEILPALPEAWNSGSFSGLVARGNFVVSAAWTDGSLTSLSVTSRSGGECRLAYPGIASATVCHGDESHLKIKVEGTDRISFPTVSGQTCIVSIVRNS
jgi:alpha-L-fucosidase 2